MDEIYFTPEEFARRYKDKVTTKTLANWRSAGTGPQFTKVGGRVLYALSDVLSWETARKLKRAHVARAVAAVIMASMVVSHCS